MHKTWCFSAIFDNFSATAFAAFPLIPVSISSKIKTDVLSVLASTVFIASIILDISPPDAILLNSFSSSPTFVFMKNTTLSFPFS